MGLSPSIMSDYRWGWGCGGLDGNPARKGADFGALGEDIRVGRENRTPYPAGGPRCFRGETSGPPWVDLPCPRQRGRNLARVIPAGARDESLALAWGRFERGDPAQERRRMGGWRLGSSPPAKASRTALGFLANTMSKDCAAGSGATLGPAPPIAQRRPHRNMQSRGNYCSCVMPCCSRSPRLGGKARGEPSTGGLRVFADPSRTLWRRISLRPVAAMRRHCRSLWDATP